MFCTKCGKQNSDTAKFCAYCGLPLVEQKKENICPKCQKVYEPDMLYCSECGTRLVSKGGLNESMTGYSWNNSDVSDNPNNTQNNYQYDNQNNTQYDNQNKNQSAVQNNSTANPYMRVNLLASAKDAALYLSEKASGISKGVGKLQVYTDFIEFKKSYSATAGMFGAIGYAVSNSQAKKEPALVLGKDQIVSVRSGKYGPLPTLTVVLSDGSAYTFSAGLDINGLKKCIEAAERFIR